MSLGETLAYRSNAKQTRHAPNRRTSSLRVVTDSLGLYDAVIVVLTAIFAEFAYTYLTLGGRFEWDRMLGPSLLAAGLNFVIFRHFGLYHTDQILRSNRRYRKIFMSWSAAILLLVLIAFLTKTSEDYSRGALIVWFAACCAMLMAGRAVASTFFRHLARGRVIARRLAIVGATDLAKQLVERLANTHPEIEIVGVFDDRNPARTEAGALHDTRADIADLIAFGRTNVLDEIIITLPAGAGSRLASVVNEIAVLPVDIRLALSDLPLHAEVSEVETLNGVPLIRALRRPIGDWAWIAKGIEDRLLSAILLAGLAIPMAAVAIAIKLESRGPVLFRQRRHGFNHGVVNVLKFRTMSVMEDGDVVRQATRQDSRVTRVGRFLRATSIDELPQLLNVLKGEMSLVGPRPHALAHNEYYAELIANYANRHRVKPGITGWAQVNGLRGETETPEMMKARIDYDLDYIENWSLLWDLKILLMTLPAVFRKTAAY